MSKFNKGDEVVSVKSGSLVKGKILSLYEEINKAVVGFEYGTEIVVEKVSLDDIAHFNGDNKDQEPVEIKEITITPEEFKEIAADVCKKVAKEIDPLAGLTGAVICGMLHSVLFIEGDND